MSTDVSIKSDKKPYKLNDCEYSYLNKDNNNTISLQNYNNECYSTNEKAEEKLKPISFTSAVFLMSQLALGVGCLNISKIFTDFSLLFGVIFIIVISLLSYTTFNYLAIVACKYNIYEYSTLVRKTLNKKFSIIFDLSVITSCFVTVIVYLTIINKIIAFVVYEFNEHHLKNKYSNANDFYNESSWANIGFRSLFIFTISFGIYFPLCLKKSIGEIKAVIYASITVLLLVATIFIIEAPSYVEYYYKKEYKRYDDSTHINWYDLRKGFNSNLMFFVGITDIFFLFDLHFGLFPVYKSLKNNTEKNLIKLNGYSTSFILAIILLFGIVGFLHGPIHPTELMIFREKIPNSSDYLMKLAMIFICVVISAELLLNMNSVRLSFFQLIKNSEVFSDKE